MGIHCLKHRDLRTRAQSAGCFIQRSVDSHCSGADWSNWRQAIYGIITFICCIYDKWNIYNIYIYIYDMRISSWMIYLWHSIQSSRWWTMSFGGFQHIFHCFWHFFFCAELKFQNNRSVLKLFFRIHQVQTSTFYQGNFFFSLSR
jgi:hypothetical protein